MNVGVARGARRFESEEGGVEAGASTPEARRIAQPFGPVALAALERAVHAREHVARLLVIEGRDSLVAPPHQREVAAVVLDVAALAVLVTRSRVEAQALRDPGAECSVTIETELGCDALPGAVALETTARPLELGVRRGEWAWR
jgi:hypothetical protein